MFGLGPAEILLIATVIVVLLVVLVIGALIIYAASRLLSGKRESKLEARVAELERKLEEQQKK